MSAWSWIIFLIFIVCQFSLISAAQKPGKRGKPGMVVDIKMARKKPKGNSGDSSWESDDSSSSNPMMAQDRSMDDEEQEEEGGPDDQDIQEDRKSRFRVPGLRTAGRAVKWGASAVKHVVKSTLGGVKSRASITKDRMSGMLPRLGQKIGQIGKEVPMENWHYLVRGKFLCGEHPSNGSETQVKLLSYGLRKIVTMGKMRIKNSDGSFSLYGFATRKLPPNPYLHIYTSCNNAGQRCARRWRLKLPDEYIMFKEKHDGYYLGEFNLFTKFPGEEKSCNH